MRAGDGDQALLGAELGQQGAAVDRLDAALAGKGKLGVAGADRGRDDDLGPLGQVGGVMADDGMAAIYANLAFRACIWSSSYLGIWSLQLINFNDQIIK